MIAAILSIVSILILSTMSFRGREKIVAYSPTSPKAREKVVAYVPNWVDLTSFSAMVDYAKVTHVNVAFENPIDDRGELSFNEAEEVLIARAHARDVKVLVSIGGGDASEDELLKARYSDLLAGGKRAGFVARLSGYIADHGFDGVDVDLEGRAINEDYGAFIGDLASALKPGGKMLTAALSRGNGGSNVPNSAFEHFDFVNVMAYDAVGFWDPKRPGQHSSLAFAKRDVEYWAGRGLPASKIVLGVPFYGYGFGKAFRRGSYPYSEIVAVYPGAENTDQVGETIWYNGIPTIEAKVEYAVERGLAGVMIWSLDNDVKDEKSLLDAITRVYHARSGGVR